jgi:hypothetical protein
MFAAPVPFPFACAPFAQENFSILLDTHVPGEQDYAEFSPFLGENPATLSEHGSLNS